MTMKRAAKSLQHSHGVCSNKDETFVTFRGCIVKGFVRYKDYRILIFECGWGLAINHSGAFWTESPDAISRIVGYKIAELSDVSATLSDLLSLAGGSR